MAYKCPVCTVELATVPIRCRSCDQIIITCPTCMGTGRYDNGRSAPADSQTAPQCPTCLGVGIMDERKLASHD